MPRRLSSFGILQKNKLASDTSWLIMLEITIPGVSEPARVTSNNESVTWRGESWIAFPFELEEISEEGKGEVPRVELRVSNVNRVMESYLQDYDLYTKNNGYTPIEVRIYVVMHQAAASEGVLTDSDTPGAVTDSSIEGVMADTLSEIISPEPEVEHLYELLQPRTNSMWATFTLGAANPFNQRFPPSRILKNHCRFIFKSTLCGYSGATTTCDKTLNACRNMNGGSNSIRFGGFPGVGSGGIRIVA